MSDKELHDLFVELEKQRRLLDPVSQEQNQLLDEIIESLEQQKLYPQAFDQFSSMEMQIKEIVRDYESEHPAFSAVLNSILLTLNNFKI